MAHQSPRRAAAAPLATALLVLLTGCTSGATTPSDKAGTTSSAVGSLTVKSFRAHLELTDGLLQAQPSGAAELTVTVRNEGSVPEHLAQVSTAANGRSAFQAGKGPENLLSTAGVLIRPGESVTFGGDGPRILFPAPATPPAATAATTGGGASVDTIMIFAVAGLVHLPAKAAA
ncbi:hypothetical protein OG871_28980 [Kitasatospora sp. NBC_00374]|uniref:hypothetical protein n=1 Tax=Kitasatospora sp. NBC_00374 TaxID=2975964 RepID=UPI0030DE0276